MSTTTSYQSLPPNIHIKPDLSPEDRKADTILLKERWRLISSGHDRKSIKIRGSFIFANNNLHDKVTSFTLSRASSQQRPVTSLPLSRFSPSLPGSDSPVHWYRARTYLTQPPSFNYPSHSINSIQCTKNYFL